MHPETISTAPQAEVPDGMRIDRDLPRLAG